MTDPAGRRTRFEHDGAGTLIAIVDPNGSRNRLVTINELVSCVAIALGTAPPSGCPACDADGNGLVGIAELVQSVLIALGQKTLLEAAGSCLEPGPAGLVPCAEDTVILVTRCDELPDCLTSGAGTSVAEGTIGAGGSFELELDICQVVRSTLVFTAQVDPQTSYRVIDLGPAGTGFAAAAFGLAIALITDIVISPVSEAAVRLLAQPGAESCSADEIQAIQSAVESANDGTVFTGLDPGAAVEAALAAAQADAAVQAAPMCAQAIGVDVEINPDPVMPGETMNVLITVTNSGTDAVKDVEVETLLPDQITAFAVAWARGAEVMCPAPNRGICSPGERVVWTIDRLPGEAGVTVSIPPAAARQQQAPAERTFQTRVRVAGTEVATTRAERDRGEPATLRSERGFGLATGQVAHHPESARPARLGHSGRARLPAARRPVPSHLQSLQPARRGGG